ncbi:uridylyltransferase [Macrococcus hajekii]|uniref:Uridylyltransferase n=1 Tax=Macrococcus hajekii TaxID=198482 RepID=A0A4R6BJ13_9STAP|nr:UTP--glucose-1-phosphate uridylyltransferase [Macrococcus hajekii]TDM01675.1 uridylyltransferase [Macrococcus hajekii]GGB13284.1 putative uridylyltransferase [Macrococcus hajekii]
MANLQDLTQHNQFALADMLTMMSEDEKNQLALDLDGINLEEVETLYNDVYVNRQVEAPAGHLADVDVEVKSDMTEERRSSLEQLGLEAIKVGRFAALLMAGGQGTRLAHPGPKGTFSFNDISLFELQAKQLLKLSAECNTTIPWFIMTSDINHDETIEFFKTYQYFNYDEKDITFFKQPNIVALSPEGQLLLNAQGRLLTAPNGNGGIYEALAATGLYQTMKKRGVDFIYLNNIDNVLVKVLDPVFCGLAVESEADVTTKTIKPLNGESVGRVIMADNKKQVMEYTELPEGMENQFDNGNIGIHIFRRDFLEEASAKALPYHLAIKNLEQLDEDFAIQKKETLKFEKFYFDIFRYADSFKTLQVDRTSEFSPLKNKEGKDSIETAHQALVDNHIL